VVLCYTFSTESEFAMHDAQFFYDRAQVKQTERDDPSGAISCPGEVPASLGLRRLSNLIYNRKVFFVGV